MAEESGSPNLISVAQVYLAKFITDFIVTDVTQEELLEELEMVKQVAAFFREKDFNVPYLADSMNAVALADFINAAALIHLSLGQVDEALQWSDQGKALIEKEHFLFPPQAYFFTRSLILRALGREDEAGECLKRAYERVMLVAQITKDPNLRRSWLENVRLNQEILAAASKQRIAQ